MAIFNNSYSHITSAGVQGPKKHIGMAILNRLFTHHLCWCIESSKVDQNGKLFTHHIGWCIGSLKSRLKWQFLITAIHTSPHLVLWGLIKQIVMTIFNTLLIHNLCWCIGPSKVDWNAIKIKVQNSTFKSTPLKILYSRN